MGNEQYQQYIENELIKIRFDKQMLEEFTGYSVDNPQEYFKQHKRAKKPPFENLWGKKRLGTLPSWNRFLNVKDRVMQNNMKQHIADYTEYCLRRQEIPRAYLDKYIVLVVQYKPDKSKSDNDNTCVKPSLDGCTHYEMWKDDNFMHMRLYLSFSVYDKANPHTDLLVFPIYEEHTFGEVMQYVSQYVINLEEEYKI